jgi:hypothetical protein
MTTTGLGKFRRQEIQFRAKKKEHTGVVKIDNITERDTLAFGKARFPQWG